LIERYNPEGCKMRVAPIEFRLAVVTTVFMVAAFFYLNLQVKAFPPPSTGASTMLQAIATVPGQAPADLEAPGAVQAGAHLFRENCAQCHGAPGIAASIQGLTPAPPNLLGAGRRNAPRDVFSKVKNGISGTAMPAWGDRLSDQDIWSLAGFLHHSRGISPADYSRMQGPNEAKP
jgi:mono/diheme cytochrome c family protein